jgi:TRAP-type uncharacterized transport system fused permease subunit
MGVPALAAHLFVFYFGCLSTITRRSPSGRIRGGACGGNPNRTGLQALKLAASGFLVPYIFVFAPQLLMIDASGWTIVQAFVTGAIGVLALSVSLEGFYHILLRL